MELQNNSSGGEVESLNTLTGDVILTAGSNITLTPIGQTITIASTGGGGGVTSVASADGSVTVTNPTTTVDLAIVKAPKLTTARTIGGTSFDGTANITVATATGGFTVSGGNVTADATTFFVDATNHRIGIGTITPSVILDIIGTSIRQANSATDSTNKAFRFQTRNFTNANNDFLLVFGQSKTSANTLILGGGQTGSVAASTVSIFTGAGNNTDTGTARLTVDSSGNVLLSSLTASKVVFTDSLKNLTSTGIGTSVQFIKGDGSLDSNTYQVSPTTADLTAQSAAVASVVTATSPNDGNAHQYSIGGYLVITAISAGTVTFQLTYTDETATSRTANLFPMGLTSASLTATGAFQFPNTTIRVNPNTAITLVTTFAGVSVTYDVGGFIQKIN